MTVTDRIRAQAKAQEAERSEGAGKERTAAYEERLRELAEARKEQAAAHVELLRKLAEEAGETPRRAVGYDHRYDGGLGVDWWRYK